VGASASRASSRLVHFVLRICFALAVAGSLARMMKPSRGSIMGSTRQGQLVLSVCSKRPKRHFGRTVRLIMPESQLQLITHFAAASGHVASRFTAGREGWRRVALIGMGSQYGSLRLLRE
jgi:hypothetical protein